MNYRMRETKPARAVFHTLVAIGFLALLPWAAEAEGQRTADELYRVGVTAFERGEIESSVEAFDALVAMNPERKPRLWQRGISLYYANRLDDCIAQFESHRDANPDDVENSVWHYLCVSASKGEAAARTSFFPARDSRIPMMAVHRLYAGEGDVDSLFAEVETKAKTPEQTRIGSFYAHLYVALWYESRGDSGRTASHLEQALDGPEIGHYMETVARVHRDRLAANTHRIGPDPQSEFFEILRSSCGSRFEGESVFPADPGDDFRGKTLIATIETCDENQIRIPFHVGKDTSRTWVLSRVPGGLELKHDHRHEDGTPDEITMYGGTTAQRGTKFSQTFPADEQTAELIPEAATNEWSLILSRRGAVLTYRLKRHGKLRFKARLERVP